jgi:hypothetical protein
MIGGVNHRDHAVRRHRVSDDGGVRNHRQTCLPNLFTLIMPSA